MFFEEWYKNNIGLFSTKNEKEKMLEAYNYGFEEGIIMGKESVPLGCVVSQAVPQAVPSEPSFRQRIDVNDKKPIN